MGPKGVPDTKTDRPTDHRSKHQLNSTDKRQARPLVREGDQQRQHSEIQTELMSGRKFQGGLDAKT
jgi:hypothetical protein